MEQSPSVGRIVHYVSYGTPPDQDGVQRFTSQCRAAIITEVVENQYVKLCVLNPSGIFFDDEIYYDAGVDWEHNAGTWHWPERV